MAEDIRKTINNMTKAMPNVYCGQCGKKLFFSGKNKNAYMSYDYCDTCCEEGMEEETRQAWEDEELIGRRIDGRIK